MRSVVRALWGLAGATVLLGCSPNASAAGDSDMVGVATDGTVGSGSSSSGSGDTDTGTVGGTESLDGSSSTGSETSTGEPPPEDGLLAYLGTLSAPGSSGVQMVDGVGFEPRAVLLWITEHSGEGIIDGARVGRGWSDGSTNGAVATTWEHEGNGAHSRWIDDACVTLVDEAGELVAEAAVTGMSDDGFSLDWSMAGEGRQVVFLALGGTIQARVGNDVLASPTETIDGVGFQPSVVLLAGVELMVSAGTSDRGGHGFGGAIPMGPSHGSAHRESPAGDGSSGVQSDVALVTVDEFGAPQQSYGLSGAGLDGFGLTRQLGTNTIGATWLVLEGVAASAGVLSQPIRAGEQLVPLGFEPVVVMFDGGDKALGWDSEPEIVHGVAVGPGSQAALWLGRRDTTTRSAWDLDHAVVSHDADVRGAMAMASLTAVDATGFTLGWSMADDVPRQIGWFALGSAR